MKSKCLYYFNKLGNNIFNNFTFVFILLTSVNIFLFILDFLIFGSGINGDTPEYLYLANKIKEGVFPFSESYLPGFPSLVAIFSILLQLKIYQASIIVIGALYLFNLFLFYKLFKLFVKIEWIEKRMVWVLMFFFTSWWVFRIQKATHADSLYFSFLIIYTYCLIKCFQKFSLKYYFLLGLCLFFGVIIKYNFYVFLPITAIIILFSRELKFREKLVRLVFVSFLPVMSIWFWRKFNGYFIKQFETETYLSGEISFLEILKVGFRNFSDFGQTIIEIVSIPEFARILPDFLTISVSLIALGLIFISMLNLNLKEFSFNYFSILAFFYFLSFFLLSSINLFTEFNQRTLISFNFYLILLTLIFLLKNRFYKILLVFSFSFFVLTLGLSVSWLKFTSKSNSFYYLGYDEQLYDFIKSNPTFIFYSDRPNYVMFHSDYKIKVNNFDTRKEFKFGKFRDLDKNHELINFRNIVSNDHSVCFIIFKNYNINTILEDTLYKDKILYFNNFNVIN